MEQIRSTRRLRSDFIPEENEDDLSSNAHRQLLGILGIALPLMVFIAAGWRPVNGAADRWALLESISGYYHTGAEAVFIGIVVALGIFLITYDGYDNPTGWKDRLSARIAGIGALVLAFFPTEVEGHYPPLTWWEDYMGTAHFIGAATLFISFAYMSYFLFPITDKELDPSKQRRNALHRACGIVIACCLIWAGIAGFVLEQSIFWPETVMLLAFGVSWLVKGKVVETSEVLGRRAKRGMGQMFGGAEG
ncbi:MAG: hypothetical protein IPK70_14785 [Flavobacteriales bacterium]|jgi:hypothetical protein|nr:hypothetical protein [Flavobacteriales bacterium]